MDHGNIGVRQVCATIGFATLLRAGKATPNACARAALRASGSWLTLVSISRWLPFATADEHLRLTCPAKAMIVESLVRRE
jgi:hypothetical protein